MTGFGLWKGLAYGMGVSFEKLVYYVYDVSLDYAEAFWYDNVEMMRFGLLQACLIQDMDWNVSVGLLSKIILGQVTF